jgi:hypothetical protein
MSSKCTLDSNCGTGQYCDVSSHECMDKPSQGISWNLVGIIVMAGLALVVIYYNIVKRLRAGSQDVKPFIVAAVVVLVAAVLVAWLFRPKAPKCPASSIACGPGTYPVCNLSTGYNWQCTEGLCKDPEIFDSKCNICRLPCSGQKNFYDCASKQCTCDPSTPTCGNDCCDPKDCSRDEKGNPVCCSEFQKCVQQDGSTLCCGGGDVCQAGQCVPACGISDPSDPKTARNCKPGEICTIISGLSKTDADRIVKTEDPAAIVVEAPNGTFTLYLCKDAASGCAFDLDKRAVGPASVNNFYPCYKLAKHDASAGLGFCSSSNADQTSKTTCFLGYKDAASCGAAGSSDSKCVWWDVGSKASGMNVLNQELATASQQSLQGWWCSKDEQAAFSRFFSAPGAGTCTWKDCWNQLAQPGVTDLYWDATANACSAIQSCDADPGAGYTNKAVINGKVVDNPSVKSIAPPGGAESFTLQCPAVCPSDIIAPYQCGDDGEIGVQKRYSCNSANWTCYEDAKGIFGDSSCGGQCVSGCSGHGSWNPTKHACDCSTGSEECWFDCNSGGCYGRNCPIQYTGTECGGVCCQDPTNAGCEAGCGNWPGSKVCSQGKPCCNGKTVQCDHEWWPAPVSQYTYSNCRCA